MSSQAYYTDYICLIFLIMNIYLKVFIILLKSARVTHLGKCWLTDNGLELWSHIGQSSYSSLQFVSWVSLESYWTAIIPNFPPLSNGNTHTDLRGLFEVQRKQCKYGTHLAACHLKRLNRWPLSHFLMIHSYESEAGRPGLVWASVGISGCVGGRGHCLEIQNPWGPLGRGFKGESWHRGT